MDAQVAVGRIAEVIDHASAVFLIVDLVHQTEGAEGATQARVRLLSPYAGPGFGDYWMPEIGQLVLCFFPGLGGDGSVGGDIDEGYAMGVIPGAPVPPQDGVAGQLSATRRVFKGRAGTAYDRLIQGSLDSGTTGAEIQTNGATFRRTIVGLAEWLGEAAMKLISQVSLTLSGVNLVELISETKITSTAPIWEVEAATSAAIVTPSLSVEAATSAAIVTPSLSVEAATNAAITTPSLAVTITNGGTGTIDAAAGVLSIGAAEVGVISPDVRLGDGTLRKLIDERFIALFNAHRHSSGGSPVYGPDTISVVDCATVATEAS